MASACESYEYCDPVLNQCIHCRSICDPKRDTAFDCFLYCKGFFIIDVPATNVTTKHRDVTENVSAVAENVVSTKVFIATVSSLVALFLVIFVILAAVIRKLNAHQKELLQLVTRQENATINSSSSRKRLQHTEDLHQTKDQCTYTEQAELTSLTISEATGCSGIYSCPDRKRSFQKEGPIDKMVCKEKSSERSNCKYVKWSHTVPNSAPKRVDLNIETNKINKASQSSNRTVDYSSTNDVDLNKWRTNEHIPLMERGKYRLPTGTSQFLMVEPEPVNDDSLKNPPPEIGESFNIDMSGDAPARNILDCSGESLDFQSAIGSDDTINTGTPCDKVQSILTVSSTDFQSACSIEKEALLARGKSVSVGESEMQGESSLNFQSSGPGNVQPNEEAQSEASADISNMTNSPRFNFWSTGQEDSGINT